MDFSFSGLISSSEWINFTGLWGRAPRETQNSRSSEIVPFQSEMVLVEPLARRKFLRESGERSANVGKVFLKDSTRPLIWTNSSLDSFPARCLVFFDIEVFVSELV